MFENVSLVSVWDAKKFENEAVTYHDHPCYELVYYEKGRGTTTLQDKTYTFVENTYTVIPPHLLHNEKHQIDGHVICLTFQGELPSMPLFREDDSGAVRQLLHTLLAEIRDQRYGYQTILQTSLQALLVHVLRGRHSAGGEKNVAYVVGYLQQNYRDRIVLADCAKQLNISYDYFQHKFKEHTGMSPRGFLLHCRIDAAKKLLERTSLDCTEIAYRCGFSTSAQFAMLFKREVGMSPLQYRKRDS